MTTPEQKYDLYKRGEFVAKGDLVVDLTTGLDAVVEFCGDNYVTVVTESSDIEKRFLKDVEPVSGLQEGLIKAAHALAQKKDPKFHEKFLTVAGHILRGDVNGLKKWIDSNSNMRVQVAQALFNHGGSEGKTWAQRLGYNGITEGVRFQKRIHLGGVTLNLNKGGESISFGKAGKGINIGKKGVTTHIGLPGTGLSYRANPHHHRDHDKKPESVGDYYAKKHKEKRDELGEGMIEEGKGQHLVTYEKHFMTGALAGKAVKAHIVANSRRSAMDSARELRSAKVDSGDLSQEMFKVKKVRVVPFDKALNMSMTEFGYEEILSEGKLAAVQLDTKPAVASMKEVVTEEFKPGDMVRHKKTGERYKIWGVYSDGKGKKSLSGTQPDHPDKSKRGVKTAFYPDDVLKEGWNRSGGNPRAPRGVAKDPDDKPFEVYGVKGMNSKPFRMSFKSRKHFEKWQEKNGDNHKIHGQRDLDETTSTKKESTMVKDFSSFLSEEPATPETPTTTTMEDTPTTTEIGGEDCLVTEVDGKKVINVVSEKHIGFNKLERKLAHNKSVTNAGALAAYIGREKYGKKKFQAAAKSHKEIEEATKTWQYSKHTGSWKLNAPSKVKDNKKRPIDSGGVPGKKQ